MKANFLNHIFSILIITFAIFGTMSGSALASDGQLGDSGNSYTGYSDTGNSTSENSDIGDIGSLSNGNLDTLKSSSESPNTGNLSTEVSEADVNYNSSTNSSEIDSNNFEPSDYDNSEEFDYNDSGQLDYNDSEQYITDDESYIDDGSDIYDSGNSDLDVIRDLYWIGIDIIEPEEKINFRELAIRNVMGGYPVRFDFVENATYITYIKFDPLKTFRKTTSTAEVLNDISVFVPELPTGRIYQYIDIFVGNKGAGLPSSLKNGLIGFKVEKSWIKDNNVNETLVTLNWFNNSWMSLPTEKIGEDNNYVYFESTTPGFSFFAITEYTGETNENYTGEANKNYTGEADENYTGEIDENYTEK